MCSIILYVKTRSKNRRVKQMSHPLHKQTIDMVMDCYNDSHGNWVTVPNNLINNVGERGCLIFWRNNISIFGKLSVRQNVFSGVLRWYSTEWRHYDEYKKIVFNWLTWKIKFNVIISCCGNTSTKGGNTTKIIWRRIRGVSRFYGNNF
jgi:hypothetical protein